MATPKISGGVADPKTTNAELLNRGIRHSVYLERLKTTQVDEIVNSLSSDLVPSIRELLQQRLSNIATRGYDTSPSTTLRLRQLLTATDGLISGALRTASKKLQTNLNQLAVSEADFQQSSVQQAAPIDIDFVTPSPVMLSSIVTDYPFQGKTLSEWFSGVSQKTQGLIQQQLTIGLGAGESTDSIVSRIMDQGVLAQTERDVTSIVRTSINHVSSQAREMTYDQNSDVVDQVLFVATLDDRTTLQCASLDGNVYDVGYGPRPPLHWNCRSTTVPVLKSWKALGINLDEAPAGTRASMDGQVPDSLTYGPWLMSQPDDVQDEALGPERAALFRSGDVTIDKFVDSHYQPLTLDQLRKQEGLPNN